ncbi:recombinase family protein, partial [Elusimicrobiota bacterium]
MVKGVKQGNWQGARYAPYGYAYNKAEKLLEIDEEEAKVVKIIFQMCIADKSANYITAYLTKRKYRNRKGNLFTPKLIRDILKNRIYIGELVWNKYHYDKTRKTQKGYSYVKNPIEQWIIAKGNHEPIIDREDFEQAQVKVNESKQARRRNRSSYPLSGILYCAKCNHKYLGHSAVSNHKTRAQKVWYRCSGPARSFIKCDNRSIQSEYIEQKVAQILDCLLQSDKLKNSRWTMLTEDKSGSFEKIPKIELEQLKNSLKINQDKQSKLTDAFLDNLLSADVFKAKNEGFREEEEELKKNIACGEMRALERERSSVYLTRLEEFIAAYDPEKEMDGDMQKQVLGLLFKNIKIADRNIFSFDFFAPFNFFYYEELGKRSLPENYSI